MTTTARRVAAVSEDDPVLTEQTRRELADVIALADETDRWLRRHPQYLPFPTEEQRARSVPHRDCWIASAEALLHLRHAWGHARNLIPADIDRALLDSDGRWALGGFYACDLTKGWGRPFGPFVLAHGWRGQQPLDAEHERSCYVWRDAYRSIGDDGSARPCVMVGHCRDPSALEQLARDEHGLVVERLPWSWYRPDDCVAIAVSTAGIPPVARRAAPASAPALARARA